MPLALYLSAAHRHDVEGLPRLLTSGWLIERQSPDETGEQHICLDKAYHDQKWCLDRTRCSVNDPLRQQERQQRARMTYL